MKIPSGYLATAGLAIGLLAVPVLSPVSAGAAGRSYQMEATAYGPSAQDNYPYGATDYFGRPLVKGDVAVDPSVIPLKTCLYITGYSSANLPQGGYIGEADDEGGAINGLHVDLYMDTSESQVNAFGIQHVTVSVLGQPTDPSAAGTAACSGYSASGSTTTQGGSGSSSASGSSSSSGSSGGSGQTTTGHHHHHHRHYWRRLWRAYPER